VVPESMPRERREAGKGEAGVLLLLLPSLLPLLASVTALPAAAMSVVAEDWEVGAGGEDGVCRLG